MIMSETIASLAASDSPKAKLHLNSPHTFHGEPVASPLASDMRKQMEYTEFDERYYYINNTHKPITIMRRDGVGITVSHRNSYTSCDFTVRKVIRLKGMALETAVSYLRSMADLDTEELCELKRALCSVEYHSYSEATVMLDYVITLNDLCAKKGSVYHYKLDLMVSTDDAMTMPAHPYSCKFKNIGAFGIKREYDNQPELNLKIRLIDHSPTACKKYINIAGKVFCLTPQRDAPSAKIVGNIGGKRTEKKYDNYLEILYSAKNDPQVHDRSGIGFMRVALEHAKEAMGLYDTYADAFNSGDADASRREKLAAKLHEVEILKTQNLVERSRLEKMEMEHKAQSLLEKSQLEKIEMEHKAILNKQRHDLEILQAAINAEAAKQKKNQMELDAKLLKLENDRKMLDMQRKEQDDKLERERKEHQEKLNSLREEQEARLKNESLYWKDFYEQRAQNRKDTSDFARFVPGLLIGIAGIAGTWMKFSTGAQHA